MVELVHATTRDHSCVITGGQGGIISERALFQGARGALFQGDQGVLFQREHYFMASKVCTCVYLLVQRKCVGSEEVCAALLGW